MDLVNFVLEIAKQQPWTISLVPMLLGFFLIGKAISLLPSSQQASGPQVVGSSEQNGAPQQQAFMAALRPIYGYFVLCALLVAATYIYSSQEAVKENVRLQTDLKTAQTDAGKIRNSPNSSQIMTGIHSTAIRLMGTLLVKQKAEAQAKKDAVVMTAIDELADAANDICNKAADGLDPLKTQGVHKQCSDKRASVSAIRAETH